MDVDKKISYKEAKEMYKASNSKIIDENINCFIKASGIEKIYPNGVQAVFNFNVDINEHEFIVLVGPSGCGKSTTLRMIAGLEEISNGKLYIDKLLANAKSPDQRNIAMVFQSYALYPHMNVYDNMSFGLKINKAMLPLLDKKGNKVLDEKGNEILTKRHYSKAEIDELVFHAAKILNLGDYLDRKPKELSGGQMQRVALGRAIVRHPKVFLMDEPLSNLDAKLRVSMRSEIVKIHNDVGATTIYVTHDQTEAMTMADRIVVMNMGHISQVDTPKNIYEKPANLFAATFIGSPSINLLNAQYCDLNLRFNEKDSLLLSKDFDKKIKEFFAQKYEFYKGIENREILKHEDLIPQIRDIIKHKDRVNAKNLLKLEYLPEKVEQIKELISKAVEDIDFKKNLKKVISLLEEKDYILSAAVDELNANKPMGDAYKPTVIDKHGKKSIGIKSVDEERKIIHDLVEYFKKPAKKIDVIAGIRSEFIKTSLAKENTIEGKVTFSEYLGAEQFVHFTYLDKVYVLKTTTKKVFEKGSIINLVFDSNEIRLFDPLTGFAIN